MLVLFIGLPGSGKTTLARAYVQRHGGLHLNSDMIRGELGLRGHYSRADKQRVYDSLFQHARQGLLEGRKVVVDSTLYRKDLRQPYLLLAAECRVPIRIIELKAAEDTILERIGRPRPDSEADAAVYNKIRAAYEPIEEPHFELPTDAAGLDELVEQIHRYLKDNDR